MTEGCSTPLCKLFLDVHALLVGRMLPACIACLGIEWLLSTKNARAKMLYSGGSPALASAAVSEELCEDIFTPYTNEDADV